MNDKIAIIILNWNGWQDTCECLSSIMNSSYNNYQIIVIDNGSEDDSVLKIRAWAHGKMKNKIGPQNKEEYQNSISFKELHLDDFIRLSNDNNKILDKLIFVKSDINHGFAKATNIGINYSVNMNFEFIFCLNNDTTIKDDCLFALVKCANGDNTANIISPLIMYYHNPKIVWSFGGKLSNIGFKKIYYENMQISNKLEKLNKRITFISGCALFARTKVFLQYGYLTEDFFFGEEDFNFSLRMKKNREKMLGVYSAKVYHKVGESNKKVFSDDRIPYIFIGYLNRFIDMKLHFNHIFIWKVWRALYLIFIFFKSFINKKFNLLNVIIMIKRLVKYSSNNNQVTKEMFFEAKKLF